MPTDRPFTRARRWLREPMLHFLLIGIALFVVHGKLAAPDRASTRIVVSQVMVDDITRQHQARWMRPPSEQELSNLIDAYVRDEILYRQGLAMGLDRDDPVIKRRVRQKFDVIAEEQSAATAPSDAELSAYMAQNPSRFLQPATITFDQIYFSRDATPAEFDRAIAAARAAVMRGADPTRLGGASMLPRHVDATALELVGRDFGADFAERLATLPIAEWRGPVTSEYGAHLVRVTGRAAAVMPSLETIRPIVAREWENERRVSSRTASYQKLLGNYEVVIDAKVLSSAAAR